MKIGKIAWTIAVLSLLVMALFPPLGAVAQIRSENIDVVLIVDTSGSMKDNDPEAIRISAAKLFVDLSEEGDRVAIVNMSDAQHTEVVLDLTEISQWLDTTLIGRRAIKESLDTLAAPIGQYTYMGTSLNLAYDILDRTQPGRRQYVVLLTDGLPTGEGEAVLSEAMDRFERKRFWKVFPIALGEGADYDFLKNEIADRSGGVAFKAKTPSELIRVYTEIFAMMRYNRYVNWITVQPGTLQNVFTIDPEQRVTNLAFVFPQEHYTPLVDTVVSPNGTNIVDIGVAGGVYHATDPRYECFVMGSEYVLLDGLWRVRLEGGGPVEMAVLVRSDYGIQLLSPKPQESWDELSPRYAPQDKDLFIQVGVRNANVPITERGDDFIGLTRPQGKLEPFLTPAVNAESPYWPPIVLRDDGLAEDRQKDDGLYTSLYQSAEETGRYVLKVQVPSRKDKAVQLSKTRVVEVRPLPTVFLEWPSPQTLPENAPFPMTVQFQQPAAGPVAINSADLEVAVKDPQRQVTVFEAQGSGEPHSTTFSPSQGGPHDISVLATIRVTQEGHEIEYTDFALATVVFPGRNLTIEPPASTDLGQMREFQNTPVTFQITSDSPEPEQLEVRVEGLEGGTVSPATLDIPPKQTVSFDLMIGSTSLVEPGPGQFQLLFTSPQGSNVQNGVLTYRYNIVQALEVWADVTDLEVNNLQGMQASLRIWSDSQQEQTLQVSVEGLAGGTVLPTRIQVPPREETSFTFSVSADDTAPRAGQFFLVLRASEEAPVEVFNGEVLYNYTVKSSPILWICLVLVLILVGAVGFLVWRRIKARREARPPWAY